MRRRLDLEMVRRGIVKSRTEAAEAIASGKVTIGGRSAGKASTLVSTTEAIAMLAASRKFVSRAGEKLEAALDRFDLCPAGRRALDAGSSTGGFVDCLLQRGAEHVVAVDVGYGQLDWGLRQDARVTVLERKNVRDLTPNDLPYRSNFTTADLSFISLRLAVGPLRRCSTEDTDFVFLVKPQFEAGRDMVGEGGVVRDPTVWLQVLGFVAEQCRQEGLAPQGVMASPLMGPAGNVEFLMHALIGGSGEERFSPKTAVEEAESLVDAKA